MLSSVALTACSGGGDFVLRERKGSIHDRCPLGIFDVFDAGEELGRLIGDTVRKRRLLGVNEPSILAILQGSRNVPEGLSPSVFSLCRSALH